MGWPFCPDSLVVGSFDVVRLRGSNCRNAHLGGHITPPLFVGHLAAASNVLDQLVELVKVQIPEAQHRWFVNWSAYCTRHKHRKCNVEQLPKQKLHVQYGCINGLTRFTNIFQKLPKWGNVRITFIC